MSPAPCIPKNLQTSADCRSELLLSKWDLAEGALRYTVEAYGNKGRNYYNCSSVSNSCAIEGTDCGDYLTVYITAFDDECASPRTLGPVAETGKGRLENSSPNNRLSHLLLRTLSPIRSPISKSLNLPLPQSLVLLTMCLL